MKKVLFSLAVVALFAATSCKKDYTCECKYDFNGAETKYQFEIRDVTKSDAETACVYDVENVSSVNCNLR